MRPRFSAWGFGAFVSIGALVSACTASVTVAGAPDHDAGATSIADATAGTGQPGEPSAPPTSLPDGSVPAADASSNDATLDASGDDATADDSGATMADATPPPGSGGSSPYPLLDAGPVDPSNGARCGEKPVSTTSYGGPCNAVEFYWPDEGSGHLQPPAPLRYCTMPPNSGPHYPWIANYQTFTTPVPDGFLVHSIQHGGISITYRCMPGENCSATQSQLQSVIDAQPADPLCAGAGVKNRYVLSPSFELDVPVAAATWDWTYRADCVDPASLQAFFDEHYGKGPETVCEHGGTDF